MYKSTTTNFSKEDALEYVKKMEAILAWAESKEKFSTKFVEDVLARTKKFNSISEKQQLAIDNIISKFKIAFPRKPGEPSSS